MSSEFLASSWRSVRGRVILSHTPVLYGTVSWVKKIGSPLNHENHENFTPRILPAIRYVPYPRRKREIGDLRAH